MMAGLAGALYVPQVGIINPGEFAPANSIEAVIWVAVGGRGTLVGAISARLVNAPRPGSPARDARTLAVRARRAVRRGDAVPAKGKSASSARGGAARARARAPPSRAPKPRGRAGPSPSGGVTSGG
jgi:urea transport system permease protein